jgi:thiosulfate/3-mercaptopyruvate sulfurtransferase
MFQFRGWAQALVLATIVISTMWAADSTDPWKKSELMTVVELKGRLPDVKSGKALLIHVGFRKLYAQGYIPGSHYAGPGNKPEGLADFKKLVEKIPHNREIIIYCGCCPWDVCPNIRPAFRALKQMGFTNIKAVEFPNALVSDWAAKGFPLTRGE